MLPPLVLGVEPHHKVLDMCAAPGSKTAQLIEALHNTEGDKLPTGFVVANDKDNSRCYMLTHQAKRLQSPAVVIINHDASVLPNFVIPTPEGQPRKVVKFDRILADVPCTGDGTMRKNPDIWPKWTPVNGANLHPVQFRIAKRGLELLEVGGRMVYSTCSLNPVENEAVIARILSESGESVRLLDVNLPGLKFKEGLESWTVSDKSGALFNSWKEVPDDLSLKAKNYVRPELFPPENAEELGLKKCVRVLPHYQNTGGFFVALLEKFSLCPWERRPKLETEEPKEDKSSAETEPAPKKKKFWGFKEDPFIYLSEDDEVYPRIKEFFSLELPKTGFLTRCVDPTKKNNIYLTTPEVRELIENNKEKVKIINSGVKAFVRCENKGAECDYRIAQEGAMSTVPYIKARCVHPALPDLTILLSSDDMEKSPEIKDLTPEFQAELNELSTGSVAFIYRDPGSDLELEVVGWKGKDTVRVYVPRNDRLHYLRLVGGDLSKFDVNKYKNKSSKNNASHEEESGVSTAGAEVSEINEESEESGEK